jgi:hypothetical protein
VPKVPVRLYIHTYTGPTPYTTTTLNSPCTSNPHQPHRPPSPSPSASPPGPPCRRPQTPSTATTQPSRRHFAAPPVPTLHGQPVLRSTTAARHRLTLAMPTCLARTLTTTLPALFSRRLQHRPVSHPWPRPFPSCHHCTRKRSPRPSAAAAAAAASSAAPPSP